MPSNVDEIRSLPHIRAYWEAHGSPSHEDAETTRTHIALERTANPDAPAEEWHAVWIPNGDYTVSLNGVSFEFRIHLVERGQLAGKRIIKVKHPGQPIFTGFAFLTRSGGFSLWQRFRRDAQAPYVVAANALIHALSLDGSADNADMAMEQWRSRNPQSWRGEVLVDSVLSETLQTASIEFFVNQARCSHCNRRALPENPRFALCADHTYIIPEVPRAVVTDAQRRPSAAHSPRARRRPAQSRTEAHTGPLMSEVKEWLIR